jgi:hypothetical protein
MGLERPHLTRGQTQIGRRCMSESLGCQKDGLSEPRRSWQGRRSRQRNQSHNTWLPGQAQQLDATACRGSRDTGNVAHRRFRETGTGTCRDGSPRRAASEGQEGQPTASLRSDRSSEARVSVWTTVSGRPRCAPSNPAAGAPRATATEPRRRRCWPERGRRSRWPGSPRGRARRPASTSAARRRRNGGSAFRRRVDASR